jgi:glutamate/aspartate transport system permease protein
MSTLDFSFLTWNVVSNFVLKGLYFSIELTLIAMFGGIVLGTLIALMRLSSKRWLVLPAQGYVDLFRSIPLVMVILWFFLLIPKLIGHSIGGAASAMITFTFFEAAYYSEIMRAGIQSVSRGQVSAGYAVGMSYAQCMKLVVLPQAFRNMLPVLLTQTIVLFQDTSLVYVLSITDFLGAASKVAQRDGRLVEMYLFAAVVYFVISSIASFGVRRLQARIAYVH